MLRMCFFFYKNTQEARDYFLMKISLADLSHIILIDGPITTTELLPGVNTNHVYEIIPYISVYKQNSF